MVWRSVSIPYTFDRLSFRFQLHQASSKGLSSSPVSCLESMATFLWSKLKIVLFEAIRIAPKPSVTEERKIAGYEINNEYSVVEVKARDRRQV
jgi:hypothetical protein